LCKKEKPNALFTGVWQPKVLTKSQINSSRFNDLAGFNTAGTNFHSPVAAGRELDPDGLEIRVKSPSCLIVSV
jgi:hypothetical protein